MTRLSVHARKEDRHGNSTDSSPCALDTDIWDGPKPLATNTWNDFALEVNFQSSNAGFVRLWYGTNGTGLIQQKFTNASACPGGISPDQLTCYTPTLDWNTGKEYLKQGLYLNSSIADSVTIYHKDTAICQSGQSDCLPPTPVMKTHAGALSVCERYPNLLMCDISRFNWHILSVAGYAGTLDLSAVVSPPGPSLSLSQAQATLASGQDIVPELDIQPATAPAGTYHVTVNAVDIVTNDVYSVPITYTINSNPTTSVAGLVDPFRDNVIDGTLWDLTSASQGVAAEGLGVLTLTPTPNTATSAVNVGSLAAYSLAGSSAFVEVPSVVDSGGNVEQAFRLFVDSQNYLEWIYSGGILSAQTMVGGTATVLGQTAYSATPDLWWQITESGGTVSWQVAPDGQTWATIATAQDSSLFSLASLNVFFHVDTSGSGSPTPGVASFANLNTLSTPTFPSVATISDPFSASALDASLWVPTAIGGATVAEGGGALVFTLPSNANAEVQVASVSAYSLIGASASVYTPSVISNVGYVDEEFRLQKDSENYLQWYVQQGSLMAMLSANNVLHA